MRALFALLVLSLVGCAPSAPTSVAEFAGPKGDAALTVEVPQTRELLWAETYRATCFKAWVSGAGISGWMPLNELTACDGATPTLAFRLSDDKRSRVATLNASVPAGHRRVFRIEIYNTAPEPDVKLLELWGAGDVPADGQRHEVPIRRLTTPTGRIFHELFQIDAPKTLTLPIPSIQHFVQELLNTNQDGSPRRAGVAQTSPFVLDVHKAAAAIVRGNGANPFQVPEPIPEALLVREPQQDAPPKLSLHPDMLRRGTLRVKAVDVHGNLTTRMVSLFLTDPASEVRHATADTVLEEVTPGTWELVLSDLERGASTRKTVFVPEGGLTTAHIVVPASSERVAGEYDHLNDRDYGFNGENTPADGVFMASPGGFAVHAGRLTYNDAGNHRLRRFDLTAYPHAVNTFAGNGLRGTGGNGGPATAAVLSLSSAGNVVIDRDGATYFQQDNATLRKVAPDGTVSQLTLPSGYPYSGFSSLGYDRTRHHLYYGYKDSGVAYRVDLTGATAPLTISFGSGGHYAWTGMACQGDYLFFSIYEGIFSKGTLYRYHIPSGTKETVFANGAAAVGDDAPASSSKIVGARSLVCDRWGNVFLTGNEGLYRLTGGFGPVADMRLKLVLADARVHFVGLDADTDAIYFSTRQPYLNAAGTARQVPVIKRLIR